jgi:hypothetical protein
MSIDALPHGPDAISIAVGAAHVHLPAKAPRHAQGLDFHKNNAGTFQRAGQAPPMTCLLRWFCGAHRLTIKERAHRPVRRLLSQSDPRRSGVPPSVDKRAAHHRCPVAIGAAHHRCPAVAIGPMRYDRATWSSASGPIRATSADKSIGF